MKPREKSAIRHPAIANDNNIPQIIPVLEAGRRLQNARIQDIRHHGSRALALLKSYFISVATSIRDNRNNLVFGS